MTGRSRLLLATLCGLVLAAGVHIVAILNVPAFAMRDAFHRLSDTLERETAQIVSSGDGETWLPRPDPAMVVAACAYDLDAGPVRVLARPGALFQSISLHSQGGTMFFATTDRAAVRGELEIVVMTQRQFDEAQAVDDENEPSQDVRIVAPRRQGYVAVRVAVPWPSQRAQAMEAAKAVACEIERESEEG